MAVGASDLVWYKADTMAAALTDTDIGGAVSATALDGSLGDILLTMSSYAAAGGDRDQHAKVFVQNDHATDTAYSGKVWIENALDDLGGNGLAQITTVDAADDATKYFTATGEDSGGNPTQEDITAPSSPGTVAWATTWARLDRVSCHLVATGAYTTVADDCTIEQDSGAGMAEIGILPAGMESASAELALWLETTLDGSTKNGVGNDTSVAPAGSSFTKPRTAATGSEVGSAEANPGEIPAASAQAVWVRWRLAEEVDSSTRIQTKVSLDFADA